MSAWLLAAGGPLLALAGRPVESEEDIGIKHHFSAGVYIREQKLDCGYEVKTHKHSFDHFGLLGSGQAVVTVDGQRTTYKGPCVIEIKAGRTHRILAVTNITWFCIHACDVAELAQIERALGDK